MRTAQLSLHHVHKSYRGHVVLDDVSLAVKPGEKVGVIGDNGSGKSTLLAIVAGRVAPDRGEVTAVAPGGVGHLPQTLDLPPHATVADAVDRAPADLRELETLLRQAEADLAGPAADPGRYASLVEEFEARGGYEADTRVEVALHGLGLPGPGRDRELGTLSGGERVARLSDVRVDDRLRVAGLTVRPGERVLVTGPVDLLLLDEPTNHLSPGLVEDLEAALAHYPGALVLVTHDRRLRERFSGTRLHLEGGEVVFDRGAAGR
ncbi:hypothetical protein GCM10009634_38710 [Saccharothrix xinjiangensis]